MAQKAAVLPEFGSVSQSPPWEEGTTYIFVRGRAAAVTGSHCSCEEEGFLSCAAGVGGGVLHRALHASKHVKKRKQMGSSSFLSLKEILLVWASFPLYLLSDKL